MQHETPGREDNYVDLKRLGDQLRALREAQGLTYEDVAEVTHVRPHVIASIEDGTIEEAAAPVFVRGFIKTYCEYLMAADLWRKYSQGIPSGEDTGDVNAETSRDPVDIIHPTPMFRRSSVIWVYIILVIAVLCAAYLLWSQHRESEQTGDAFSLRFQDVASSDVSSLLETAPSDALAAVASGDAAAVIVLSGDIASGEQLMVPVPIPQPQNPQGSVSQDNRASSGAVASGDLSWMDETSASARPVVELPQFVDHTLLIEITGSNNKLTVEQGGKVVTRRTLGIGGRRSYDVTKDTKVTISSGNKARVTWFGKRYDTIGSDNTALVLVFRPDGSVTVQSGKTSHFGPNDTAGNN
jgi:cytoskeletal protein RodZ